MSTPFGLTLDGFVTPQLTDVRADLAAAMQAAFGASIDMGDMSIFGQIVGILAERLELIWQGMQAVAASQDPDQATGAALDALCALTGTVRPAASYSTVTLTLTGDPSTVVPIASTAATPSAPGSTSPSTNQFTTTGAATLVALTAWAINTTYATNARVTANGQAFLCTVGGESASTGLGPVTTSAGVPGITPITDNAATWVYLGLGTAAVDQGALATLTGPITGTADDITIIVNPFSGWSGVINLADAVQGRNIATDAELRQLRVLELSGEGSSSQDSIRAALLLVSTVTAATVFVNNTDTVDVNGQPPHSVQAMVLGGADQDVRDCLFANVAAGIATFGTTTGTSTDSQGVTHEIDFTRPITVPIYIAITLTYDATLYPADGDTEVADAIVTFGDLFATGKDVTSTGILAQAFTVSGVLDVQSCYIGTAPSPVTSTTIAVDLFHLATFDPSRITVTSSQATP